MVHAQNHLMAKLPRSDRQHLLSLCEAVHLIQDETLGELGQPIRHAYFPIQGVISLIVAIDDHAALEVGMIGIEGMLGVQLSLRAATESISALVSVPGSAWRIEAGQLGEALITCPALQVQLFHYAEVMRAQLATAAGCLRHHQIGPRLARWLLMTQDRMQADHFHVTHEFLARMLGVRRVGITMAASALQRAGLVGYRRGEVQILDRTGLQHASCSCYAVGRKAYLDGMR